MLRITHCLDIGFRDGGKVVSLTHRPRSTSQKQYSSAFDNHFCYKLSKPQGLVRLEGLGKLKEKNIHLIGFRNRNLPAFSIVSQQLRYLVPAHKDV
jgi:hypothetical protein